MASDSRQRLYAALQEAEREWREFKQAGQSAHPDVDRFVGSEWHHTAAREAYRKREQELFARVEAARKAWLRSWALAVQLAQRTVPATIGSVSAPEAAWNDLHNATPPGWSVGRPSHDERRKVWKLYAYDQRERAQAGHRARGWTAVAATEVEVVREMARCLRLIREGRVPD